MNEEEKEAVCELKNYITKRKRSYTKLDRHDKAINNLLNLIVNLQKENTEFEKLSKDCSYSVDIVRENTRLRRQVFDLELESEKLKNTDLEQAKIEYLEVLNEKLQKENEELKILKSGIQTLQNLGIEDGKYIVMSKTDFLNGSCKHLLDDYIPLQKVKDIIDRIDYDIKKTKEIISKNTNIYASYRKNDYQIVRLRAMNTKSLDIKNRLQELLELSELNSEFNSEGKSEV
jgi:hypothetical protein